MEWLQRVILITVTYIPVSYTHLGTIMGAVTLPPGTSQERAMEILNRVDSLVAAEPDVYKRQQ